MKSVIFLLLRKAIYYISGLCPRSTKAVMGSYQGRFSDNAKYLYLHWQETDFIRAIWISGDNKLVKQLRLDGFEAYHRRSIGGIFHCLTAKYYLYNCYIGDISQYLAKGAVKVNLWHGSPLNKIQFDITSGPLAVTYHATSLKTKLFNSLKYHQAYIKPDIMFSPSPVMDALFSSAFRLPISQIHRSGNPRTDYYRRYPEKKQSIAQLFNHQYKQVILYRPTWIAPPFSTEITAEKETGLNTEESKEASKSSIDIFDWQSLSTQLQENNQLFLIRFHPNQAHLAQQLDSYANIIDISHWQDIYNIFHEVDLLITDKSSLCIDFLLYQTPTVFYTYSNIREDQASEIVASTRALITETQAGHIKSDNYNHGYDYVDNLPLFGIGQSNTIEKFEDLLIKLRTYDSFYISANESREYKQLTQLFWPEQACDAFDTIEKRIGNISNKIQVNQEGYRPTPSHHRHTL
ncbi:CDP-glycerol glycerophosphotransferase family protein [Shewanella violacea]|uniref:Teichoic acid biosynthesis protein F, putative n=1 Tax=Shewanella violacea (strain JCM 10179 / CIP 106290 / LMG 19151 / DSS12) TaxID=637905 RepID=D4ZIH6_SHEVD|nr:CDP-glycerol glycerophosphotransferase family protein [Shewanella violacea]BAJ01475.1 teichoic acid biosynthesis protein F, putative [Shewanella violacea DSS12]